MQCNQVVQGSLAGEALTLPRTSLASLRSGDTSEQGKAICFTYMHANLIPIPEQIKITYCLFYRPSIWPKHSQGLPRPTTHHVQTNIQATELRTKAFYLFYDVP